MRIPTHLLAIELHPDDPIHDVQPPLPHLPCPIVRLRVHQFPLTTTTAHPHDATTTLESVDTMGYIAPDWYTLPARSTSGTLTCWRAKEAVARAYGYLNTARDFHLSWYSQQHLECHSKSLEGQTWRRCVDWACHTVVSDLPPDDWRRKAAYRFLKVYTMADTRDQPRSQLWVGVGLSRSRQHAPGMLGMFRWGTGLKPEWAPRG